MNRKTPVTKACATAACPNRVKVSVRRNRCQACFSAALRQRRKVAGLCQRCGRSRRGSASRELCTPCRALRTRRSVELSKERRRERRRNGWCTNCGAPAAPFATCFDCRMQRAEKARPEVVHPTPAGAAPPPWADSAAMLVGPAHGAG